MGGGGEGAGGGVLYHVSRKNKRSFHQSRKYPCPPYSTIGILPKARFLVNPLKTL